MKMVPVYAFLFLAIFLLCVESECQSGQGVAPATRFDSPQMGTMEETPTLGLNNENESLVLLPRAEDFSCGLQFQTRLCGLGKEVCIGEYAWLAALFYEDGENRTRFGCTGALINDRYVLAAAHCVNRVDLGPYRLRFVRLGERVQHSDRNCTIEPRPQCFNRQDFLIENYQIHPNFLNGDVSSDIALIRLKEAAAPSLDINTACLPFDKPFGESVVGKIGRVAGWGTMLFDTTQGREDLLQVRAVIRDKAICENQLRSVNAPLKENQICVEEDRSSATYNEVKGCIGDSGNPLILSRPGGYDQWFLIGLESRDEFTCTQKLPRVYTYIPPFLPWIQENVEP